MKVVVAGDWHGNTNWAIHTLHQSAKVLGAGAVVLHLGDFGIWPGREGQEYLLRLEDKCAELGITIMVTPGNHEDWATIDAWPLTDRGDGWGAVKWFTNHIAVLPRGHRFTLAGKKFVSLGGAPSIDLHYRVRGRSWWPQEAITSKDVEVVAAGGYADYMLTHDAPEPLVPLVHRIVFSPSRWHPDALDYCAEGRRLITRAFNAVRPRVLFHGHYHVPQNRIEFQDVPARSLTARSRDSKWASASASPRYPAASRSSTATTRSRRSSIFG